MKCLVSSVLSLALIAGFTLASEGAVAKSVPAASCPVLASSIATEYIDPSALPQIDFFVYLNGKWLQTVQIPAGLASWGSFDQQYEDSLAQLRGIIENVSPNGGAQTCATSRTFTRPSA